MKSSESDSVYTPNFALIRARKLRGLTQTQLAGEIGTTYVNVCRWEHGKVPGHYFRRQLCDFFSMSPEDLFPQSFSDPTSESASGERKADEGVSDPDQMMRKLSQVLRSAKQAPRVERGERHEGNEQMNLIAQIEIDMRRVELERQKLQLEKAIRQDQREKLEHLRDLLEKVTEIVEALEPDADPTTKARYVRDLFLQLVDQESEDIDEPPSMSMREAR